MKKVLVAAFLVLITGLTFSIALAYDGWSSGEVKSVRHRSAQTLVVQNGASNPGRCSNPAYLYLEEDGSEFAKQVNADIAFSMATGQKISFALTGCSGGGRSGYPVITESWPKGD